MGRGGKQGARGLLQSVLVCVSICFRDIKMLRDAGKHSRERQQEVVVTEHMFPVPRHHLPVSQERRDLYKPSLQRDDSIGNTRASQAQHLMSVG